MVGLTNPTTNAGFALNQPSTTPSTGFSFGQTGTSGGGFSFGQTAQPQAIATATVNPLSTAAGFSFGTAPTSSTVPSSGFFSTSVAPASTGFSFGAGVAGLGNPAATTSAVNFNLPAASVPASGFALGGSSQPATGFSFQPTPASSSVPALNFGLSTVAQPAGAKPSGFNFQTPSSGSTLFGTGGTLGGATVTSTTAGSLFSISTSACAPTAPTIGLGGSLPITTTASAGLGGFQPPSIDSGVGTVSKVDGKSTKETPLPNDIFVAISLFENYKDNEKKASEENIRQTAAPFHKLNEDTKKLKQHIVKLSNQHAQLHTSAKKLKLDVIQETENVEMARRTQSTPMSLQGNYKAPERFFLRLVRSFEERMAHCRNKIDEIERCSNVNNGGPSDVTPEDMTEILRKEHETVKMLAARVYTIHSQLVDLYHKGNNPVQPIPEVLFRTGLGETEVKEINSKTSSILRPCLGDGGSGLVNFQNGQQRAKALSMGAAPPTLPLGQNSSILGLGGMNFGAAPGSTGGLFNFNNKSSIGFGTPSAGVFGQGSNPQTSSLFTPNTQFSVFGSKPFGKSVSEHEESQRKRRL